MREDIPMEEETSKKGASFSEAKAGQRVEIYDRLLKRALGRVHFKREDALKNAESDGERERLLELFNQESEEVVKICEANAAMIWRARQEAQIDSISGLLREPAFEKMYECAHQTLKEDEETAIIAFDVDFFRQINDKIGHAKADMILRQIGEEVEKAIRSDDFACRIGGDEFILFLNHIKKGQEVIPLIARIASAISKIGWGEDKRGISVSAGYTTVGHDDGTYFLQVREKADKLGNLSKRFGRNRLSFVKGNKYHTYVLGHDGYQADKSGDFSEVEITAEACFAEVKISLQRVMEEIEGFLGDGIEQHLKQNFGVRALEEVSLKKMAELLFFVREEKRKMGSKITK